MFNGKKTEAVEKKIKNISTEPKFGHYCRVLDGGAQGRFQDAQKKNHQNG
jgi:hypothetical protein